MGSFPSLPGRCAPGIVKTTIISTGEEIIRGRTADTNAAFLAAQLAPAGFDVRRILAVGDDPDLLREEIASSAADSALVVITGGLGPTADDRTRRAIAEALGRVLTEDADSRRCLEERLRSFGRQMTPGHLMQAMFPEGSTVFPNPRGSARGFACQAQGTWVVAMPGVPAEMLPMFTETVLPFLLDRLTPGRHVRMEAVSIFPASESEVDERIADISAHGRNPSIGITVKDGVVSVSVRAWADDAADAERLLAADLETLTERFGDRIFGRGPATLADAVRELLERRGMTIAVAESVTGGLVGHMLTDVPGISRAFVGGVIAYADEVKVSRLGVPPGEIERHGAVSPQVAESMARGVCRLTGAHLGLSTTGIAGPTGGTVEKPVGLVYVGVCLEGETLSLRLGLRGDRWQIKDRASKHALNAARLALLRGMCALRSGTSG